MATVQDQPSFVNIDLLPPVLYEKGKDPEKYLLKLNQHLLHISQWSQQLDSAVRDGWLVPNARVISISAEKVTANTIFTQDLFIGEDQSIQIKGTTDTIDVYDDQATPELRTRIGKLGAGDDNYGQSWFNPSGTEIMRVGDTVFVDGAIIKDATLTGAKIINGEIINSKLDNASVSNSKLQNSSVDENKRITVYSQTASQSTTNVIAGGMGAQTKSFTHSLGRKVVVVPSFDTISLGTNIHITMRVEAQTTSSFRVVLQQHNTGGVTQSFSYTLRVDYW